MNIESPIKLVVFDWAGTTVDYGSFAPMEVFKRVFDEAGIFLSRSEISGPMGMEKKAHIRSLLSLESASDQWRKKYSRDWDESDVEKLYLRFEEKLHEVVVEYTQPIPGVLDAVSALRQRGLKIGSTTGYNDLVMEKVIPAAEKLGYSPDCVITPDATGIGRPSPFMLMECMRRMNVYPPCAVVKVGDTIADILEGKNAGAWSIGILAGSNLLGLTADEYAAMPRNELEQLKAETAKRYYGAGADFVIDNISELPDAIDEISRRLKAK